eukprot:scaffold185924_cov67-Cyclotella_meneghiniana.AAC.9
MVSDGCINPTPERSSQRCEGVQKGCSNPKITHVSEKEFYIYTPEIIRRQVCRSTFTFTFGQVGTAESETGLLRVRVKSTLDRLRNH